MLSRGTLLVAGLAAVAWVQMSDPSEARQEPRRQTTTVGSNSTSRAVSPVATASWFATPVDAGFRLDLLVVWRGRPGYFIAGRTSSSAGGSPRALTASYTYGDVQFDMTLTTPGRLLGLNGRPGIPLGDHNVALVDGVGESPVLTLSGLLTVDPALPDIRDIAAVIRRSPEIIAFLKCGAEIPGRSRHPAWDAFCEELARR